ncbi:hypothetical protein HYPGJ_40102 [Hyphomicrobium sp. GJ21]|nr:hypothetical protein HYPGJ_40102 [Hyphomicrobium sp. GJ21]
MLKDASNARHFLFLMSEQEDPDPRGRANDWRSLPFKIHGPSGGGLPNGPDPAHHVCRFGART